MVPLPVTTTLGLVFISVSEPSGALTVPLIT